MRYLHFDVFTDTPFEGNQLAVFPAPPPDIPQARMQRIAREMAFPESTFVFPADASTCRMRIFTPSLELPMAGHPTIGTTFALAAEGAIERGQTEFVFDLVVGPTPVSLEWEDGRLTFAWMTQQRPSFGIEIAERNAFAGAVGLSPWDLCDLPIQSVSCGLPYVLAPLVTRAAVDRVQIDRRALGRVENAGTADLPLFFFTMDRAGAEGDEIVYSRILAPAFGMAEDPATGSASGPLGCYLLRYGLVDATGARAMVNLQGAAMGRPSRIHISIDCSPSSAAAAPAHQITSVRVGGTAVLGGRRAPARLVRQRASRAVNAGCRQHSSDRDPGGHGP